MFTFDELDSSEDVIKAIQKARHIAGTTYTNQALDKGASVHIAIVNERNNILFSEKTLH